MLPVILGPMIPRGHIANGFPKPCTFLLPLPLLSAAVAGAVLAGVGDGGLPIDVCCRAICRDGNVTFADTAGVADETVGEVSPRLVDNAPAASVEGAFPVSECWREAPEDEDAISSVRARKRDWCCSTLVRGSMRDNQWRNRDSPSYIRFERMTDLGL